MKCFRILVIGLAVTFSIQPETVLGASSPFGATQVTGSFVSGRPSSFGGELDAAFLVPVVPEKGFWIGPRLGAMWERGPSTSHLDFQLGAEGTVWFVNAVGVGFAADVVVPATTYSGVSGNSDHSIHYKSTPFLTARLLRFQQTGAWALRVGIPYDTLYHLGLQVGVSLQLNGVPTIEAVD